VEGLLRTFALKRKGNWIELRKADMGTAKRIYCNNAEIWSSENVLSAFIATKPAPHADKANAAISLQPCNWF
jgi:hypothetical protein